jgi:hypothetical protein
VSLSVGIHVSACICGTYGILASRLGWTEANKIGCFHATVVDFNHLA